MVDTRIIDDDDWRPSDSISVYARDPEAAVQAARSLLRRFFRLEDVEIAGCYLLGEGQPEEYYVVRYRENA